MEASCRSAGAVAADAVSAFIKVRSRMLAMASRTLGNATEAEDVVQDAWLRWQNVDRDRVRNAPAFLSTTIVRLAINRATAARMRRETPLELWLGEPEDPELDPGALLERGQTIEAGLLLLLERLSPLERAAYVLREAFDYSYRHIARVIGMSEVNCRQLVARARKHVCDECRSAAGPSELRRVALAFASAARKGDLAGLEATLLSDIAEGLVSRSAP